MASFLDRLQSTQAEVGSQISEKLFVCAAWTWSRRKNQNGQMCRVLGPAGRLSSWIGSLTRPGDLSVNWNCQRKVGFSRAVLLPRVHSKSWQKSVWWTDFTLTYEWVLLMVPQILLHWGELQAIRYWGGLVKMILIGGHTYKWLWLLTFTTFQWFDFLILI